MKFRLNDEYRDRKYTINLLEMIEDYELFDKGYCFDNLLKWLPEDTVEKFFNDFMRDHDIEIVETDEFEEEDDE